MQKQSLLKLNLNNVKYYHRGNITIAVLKVDITSEKHWDMPPFPGYYEWLQHHKKHDIRFEVVGRATCHDDDKYDKTLGERIALGRAKMKALKRINAMLTWSNDYLNACAKEVWDSKNKVWDYYHTEEAHLNELLNLEK